MIKRVLHLTNNLSRNSGIMNVVMNYFRHIDKMKVQFDFLCFECDEFSYDLEIKELGGRVYKVKKTNNPVILFNRVKFLINRENLNYEIIHYHSISLWGLIIPYLKRRLVSKIIIHTHNTKFSDSKFLFLRNMIVNRLTNTNGDYFFSCSANASSALFSRNQRMNTLIIPNAIEYEKFKFNKTLRAQYRNELELDNSITLANIGRLSNQKNQIFLIEIMKELVKLNNKFKLVLVGEGSEKNKIEQMVNNYKLSKNIIFLNKRNDISKLMNMFDIFLFPSTFEGLGIVLLEAQANGLKCIASTNVPTEVKVVSNNIAFLELNDQEMWIKKIIENVTYERINVKKDFESSNYCIDKQANELTNIYMQIMEGLNCIDLKEKYY